LWTTYGECNNFAVMKGHTGAVLELHFNTDGRFVIVRIAFYTVCVCLCGKNMNAADTNKLMLNMIVKIHFGVYNTFCQKLHYMSLLIN